MKFIGISLLIVECWTATGGDSREITCMSADDRSKSDKIKEMYKSLRRDIEDKFKQLLAFSGNTIRDGLSASKVDDKIIPKLKEAITYAPRSAQLMFNFCSYLFSEEMDYHTLAHVIEIWITSMDDNVKEIALFKKHMFNMMFAEFKDSAFNSICRELQPLGMNCCKSVPKVKLLPNFSNASAMEYEKQAGYSSSIAWESKVNSDDIRNNYSLENLALKAQTLRRCYNNGYFKALQLVIDRKVTQTEACRLIKAMACAWKVALHLDIYDDATEFCSITIGILTILKKYNNEATFGSTLIVDCIIFVYGVVDAYDPCLPNLLQLIINPSYNANVVRSGHRQVIKVAFSEYRQLLLVANQQYPFGNLYSYVVRSIQLDQPGGLRYSEFVKLVTGNTAHRSLDEYAKYVENSLPKCVDPKSYLELTRSFDVSKFGIAATTATYDAIKSPKQILSIMIYAISHSEDIVIRILLRRLKTILESLDSTATGTLASYFLYVKGNSKDLINFYCRILPEHGNYISNERCSTTGSIIDYLSTDL